MKKISLLFVLSILSIQLSTAQNQPTETDPKKEELTSNKAAGNQWIFGLGLNTVNNSGAQFKDLSNSDHWAFGKIPFYGSVATQFTSKWAAKATLSFNYFKDGKIMNGETILGQSEGGNDAGYLAFDLGAEYYFLNTKKVAPYLLAGMGVSFFGDYTTVANPGVGVNTQDVLTLNAGLGANVWFSDHWGLNVTAIGKWGINKNSSNQSQASIGALYKL
jgi:hypothetical protein